MTPQELLARIDRGDAPPILDVRSEREFAAGHVPGAVNIPYTLGRLPPNGRSCEAEPVDGFVSYQLSGKTFATAGP